MHMCADTLRGFECSNFVAMMEVIGRYTWRVTSNKLRYTLQSHHAVSMATYFDMTNLEAVVWMVPQVLRLYSFVS